MTETSLTDGSVESRCVYGRRRVQAGEHLTGTCSASVLTVTVGLGKTEIDLLRRAAKERWEIEWKHRRQDL